ncbi:MAG TPA: 16S rRNA (guanine(527)-N(7))-methyltransferase RsmG [Lachnospiraceae bacterium]|nr:16S rRNA (guanine(527)-N(7))-methyltransferase RsmG [Lachnospiraceae bacterium]HCG59023.1 16S rRNA (guanine(527)-N(7))-methyltransferase RsmG [Lachnospiraceae bacterium]HCI85156.1 16S rRNA (guanine(527)-N(7))-methyltransferase RsmG [Lachnospiraceae bacterium]
MTDKTINECFSVLRMRCKDLGIVLTEEQTRQFEIYYNCMVEKNKVMNLTAITQPMEVVEKHYLDSLLVVRHVDLSRAISVLDMGTGAGFPGIPLKIVFPHLHVTLADSLNKRILFLDEVIDACGLTGIDTVHGRAEDLGRNNNYREQYDLVVSRAVANLSTLSEYCLPLVREEGLFVSYKSAEIEEELKTAQKAIRLLGGLQSRVEKDTIPGTALERSFVIIQKNQKTPAKFPRKAGMPGKEPIC